MSLPWFNENTCASAAEACNLTTLKWLRKHKCKWDIKTTYSAASEKNYEVFVWAVENGCPVDKDLYDYLKYFFTEDFKPNIL